MAPDDVRFLEFGPFRFDVRNRLPRAGRPVALTPKLPASCWCFSRLEAMSSARTTCSKRLGRTPSRRREPCVSRPRDSRGAPGRCQRPEIRGEHSPAWLPVLGSDQRIRRGGGHEPGGFSGACGGVGAATGCGAGRRLHPIFRVWPRLPRRWHRSRRDGRRRRLQEADAQFAFSAGPRRLPSASSTRVADLNRFASH